MLIKEVGSGDKDCWAGIALLLKCHLGVAFGVSLLPASCWPVHPAPQKHCSFKNHVQNSTLRVLVTHSSMMY